MTPGKLHLARVEPSHAGGKRKWVLFSEERVMRGKPGESRQDLLFRWNYPHGIDRIAVRYQGVMRLSELAMTMSDVQAPKAVRS